MKNLILKILTITTVLNLLLPPLTTKAWDAVYETNPALISAAIITTSTVAPSSAVTGVSTAAETSQTIFEWVQEFVTSTLKKMLLDMIVDQIVNWIQGGGDPKFVSDWQGFLRDVVNESTGEFVKELGLGFLCSPFNFQIQMALSPISKFHERAECTLDDIIYNIENFYDDFQNGSWIAYSRTWEPQNNFLGVYLMAADEQLNRINESANAAINEAVSGKGFLSTKKCVTDAEGKKHCVITTPGKIIGDAVTKAAESDIDFILEADQLNDYVTAIADALINRIIMEGVEGLQGVTTKKSPRGGYVAPTRGACAGLTGEVLEACLKYKENYGESFTFSKTTFIQQIDFTLQPRVLAQNKIKESIGVLEGYLKSANDIYNEIAKFSGAICRSGGNSINRVETLEKIQNNIKYEKAVVERLKYDQASNQIIIDYLQNAKNQISALPQDKWAEILTIYNTIADKLEPSEANSFKISSENEQKEIFLRASQNLKNFQADLELCKNTI